MPGAELSLSEDLVVSLDYSQFYLQTDDEDVELVVDLLGSEPGIAQQGGLVVVESPHQNNFEMPLRVEVWTGPPVDDLDEWEEAFEVHLSVGDDGLRYASPTCEMVSLSVPTGSYHAIIAGRGFVGHGWPGSTTPGDSWRIRLWPSPGPERPSRLRGYAEPAIERPTPMFEETGVAAAGRIHRVLHDVAGLSEQRGTVQVRRRMPGTRRTLFSKFRDLDGWLTSGAGGFAGPGEHRFSMSGTLDHPDFGDANQIVPCAGNIECSAVSEKSPAHIEFTWSWTLRPPDRRSHDEHDERPGGPLFPQLRPMTLRFDLANAEPEEHWPTTLITVTQDNVPAELVDDLTAYWQWALERGDYDFDLSGARMNHARQR